jgi:hypothetical protein
LANHLPGPLLPPWPPPRPPLRAPVVEIQARASPPCDSAAVRQALVDQQPAIVHCAAGFLGHLRLHFAVMPGGKAHAVRVRGNLPRRVERCMVERAVYLAVFPTPATRCEVAARIRLR